MVSKTKLDFLGCVPMEVRAHVAELINGSAKVGNGLAGYLAEIDAKLAKIAPALLTTDLKSEAAARLRREQGGLSSSRAALSDGIACLQRLVWDLRMKKVYGLLNAANIEAPNQVRYIHAAWLAHGDFDVVRNHTKQAAALAGQVATKAAELADLLRKLQQVGGFAPAEFFSVPDLLFRTDSTDQGEPTLSEWRVLRYQVLGESFLQREQPESWQPDPTPPQAALEVISAAAGAGGFRLTLPGADGPTGEPSSGPLRYAWQKAPRLPALLDTVAGTARGFVPSESGFVGSAIATRQRSSKAEYLRAFLTLLGEYQIDPARASVQAVTITATVAISRDGVEVLPGDVQNALKYLAENNN